MGAASSWVALPSGLVTVLCYTCLYSKKEAQGPARLRPGKKGSRWCAAPRLHSQGKGEGRSLAAPGAQPWEEGAARAERQRHA